MDLLIDCWVLLFINVYNIHNFVQNLHQFTSNYSMETKHWTFFLNSYFVFSVDQVVIHEMMIQLWTWALLSAVEYLQILDMWLVICRVIPTVCRILQ